MRVLVVDGYHATHAHRHVVDSTIAVLGARGHRVDHLPVDPQFAATMTAAERVAYETDTPLLAEETRASAALIAQCDALVFCYPTTLFGVPACLKSWLERVLVPGVGFVLDEHQRVRPGMTNVRRLGVVTTNRHSRMRTWRAGDLGRRTILRTLRLNCHPRCRRTFVRLGTDWSAATVSHRIARSLRHWH